MLQFKVYSFLQEVLPYLGVKEKIDFKVDFPPRKELGDYSTNFAIVCARKLSQNPLDLAGTAAKRIKEIDRGRAFRSVEVAPPGFINFTFSDAFLQNSVLEIIKKNWDWGKNNWGEGKRVLLEFVSANPTGPLHVGHGRWAVIGDVIGKLLEAVGYKVEREYYVNNVGTQIEKLVESVQACIEGREIPEGGYGGAYIGEIAQKFKDKRAPLNSREVTDYILEEQKRTLANLKVKFDRWFFESELHEKQKVKWAVEKLHDLGKTFEEDGAIWFKSQELGDDKNRVLIRDDGQPTYFAADIAYHLEKFSRGYDRLINIWGADHHGYVARLKAALKALGLPAEKLEIYIGQLVTLYRGKEPVRMSKRTGEMITLQEVIDEIGSDATRFFFAATDINSHLDFDLELAKKKSHENPVFYVQYAHARICSILRKEATSTCQTSDLSSLIHPAERELMIKLLSWPEVVDIAAQLRHPHRLTEYGKELAVVFHHFYEKCRVLGNPARLTLVNATRITIRNMLELLGVSTPETM